MTINEPPTTTSMTRDEFAKAWKNTEHSIIDIARNYGVNRSTILYWAAILRLAPRRYFYPRAKSHIEHLLQDHPDTGLREVAAVLSMSPTELTEIIVHHGIEDDRVPSPSQSGDEAK